MIETGTIATNKKTFRDFHIFDRWECGLELKGGEVKSLRLGNVNFKDSFARADGGEVFLYNLHILPYAQASFLNEDPDRPRKLLLHKSEIKKILGRSTQKGLVLVPTKLYFNKRGFAKVEIALGQGKKARDKREDLKKREAAKQIDRAIKQSRPRR